MKTKYDRQFLKTKKLLFLNKKFLIIFFAIAAFMLNNKNVFGDENKAYITPDVLCYPYTSDITIFLYDINDYFGQNYNWHATGGLRTIIKSVNYGVISDINIGNIYDSVSGAISTDNDLYKKIISASLLQTLPSGNQYVIEISCDQCPNGGITPIPLRLYFYKLNPYVSNTVLTTPLITNCNIVTISDQTIFPTYEYEGGTDENPSYFNLEQFHWNFGDSASGSNNQMDRNPNSTVSHTYSKPCIYTITLNSLIDGDCNSSITKTVDLYPVAGFGVVSNNVCFGYPVSFTNNSSCPYFIQRYKWNFGDGTPTSPNPVHVYAASGTYMVILTITSIADCNGDTINSTVSHPVTVTLSNPVAHITSSDPDGQICNGDIVHFTGSCTGGYGTSTCSWYPYVPYGIILPDPCDYTTQPTANGIYTLTVTDQINCTSTTNVAIQVNPLPTTPIINGYKNTCETTNPIYDISLTPPQTGVSYFWEILPTVADSTVFFGAFANGTHYANGISNIINWSFPAPPNVTSEPAIIRVYAVNNTTLCRSPYAVYHVNPCCYPKTTIPFNFNEFHDNSILSQSQLTKPYICINGTVTLDADLIFTSKVIYMSPEAKLIVASGHTVTLSKTVVKANTDFCPMMWDGIYINGDGGKLITNSVGITDTNYYTTITQAVNSIVSTQGGLFEIDKTVFVNNYKDILVRNWTPGYSFPPQPRQHRGTIYGSYFKQSSGLIAPYIGISSYVGIEVNTVNDLTIGSSTIAANKNTFKNLLCAIKVKDSKVQIYNNYFREISDTGPITIPYPPDPTEVYYATPIFITYGNVTVTNPPAAQCNIGISGNAISTNKFTKCNKGIYTFNVASTISNNNFQYGTSEAIYCKDPKTNTSITSNKVGSSGTNYVNDAIKVECVQPTILNLNIAGNDPLWVGDNGINVINCKSSSTMQVSVQTANKIYFKSGNLIGRYGIRTQNCQGIKVLENIVAFYPPTYPIPAPLSNKTMFGISTENTEGAIISGNQILGAGAGINITGNCNTTLYYCNVLNSCYFGFYLNTSASITQQGGPGSPGLSSHNSWPGTGAYAPNATDNYIRKIGSIIPPPATLNSPNWYYPDNYGIIFKPEVLNANNPVYQRVFPIALPSCTTNCVASQPLAGMQTIGTLSPSSINTGTSAVTREALYGKILRGENNYNDLDAQYKEFDNKLLYEAIKTTPMLANAGAADDYAYMQFYMSKKYDNVGIISLYEDYLRNNKVDSAKFVNNFISTGNIVNEKRKIINEIYNKSFAVGQYKLSPSDSTIVMNLVYSSPHQYGNAVYIARAMMGIYPLDYNSNRMMEDGNATDTANTAETIDAVNNDNHVVIYPNPAKEQINIEFSRPVAGNTIFEVYTLFGQKVFVKQIPDNTTSIILDVKSLTDGVYLYKLYNSSKVFASYKLVIIR
jgi:PKD repeat protein